MAVAPRGLPIPPTPVMPPEGLAPVTQQAGLGAGDDAMSPTTMVLNYLKARGYTPSSENVRRALEANQRDPGVISGLRSDRPATDAEDQAAMAAARGGGGGGRTSAAPASQGGSGPAASGPYERVDTGASPLPNANATGGGSTYERTDADTSAAPNGGGGGGGDGSGILPYVLGGGAGVGAAALAKAILDRARPLKGATIGMNPAELPPSGALPSPAPIPSPQEMAMTKALQGPAGTPALPAPPAQIAGPAGAPEAPVAAPGSVIPQPAPDVRPNIVPPDQAPLRPSLRPGGSGRTQDLLDEAAIAAGRKPAPRFGFGRGLRVP